MGTLCEGVSRNAFGEDGWTAFIRAVMEVENLRFADMLAEFENTKDKSCITALHRARTNRHPLMVELSLSVPEFMTGLCDVHARTAFDIPASSEMDTIQRAFYRNIITMEGDSTQNACPHD